MNSLRRISKVLILSLLFVVFMQPAIYKASEGEVINSFHSDIVINRDSTMQVTETIKIVSAGINIKHGIYRDFPTKYTDNNGNNYNVGFNVISVKRDGNEEEYEVSQEDNGKRVTIGSKDVTLSNGEHTYTIVYITNRQIGYFENNDELFWNVTGNGWAFPIEEASASVTIPKVLDSGTSTLGGYTGVNGSTEKNLEYSIDTDGKAVFKTTKALLAGEGLSVYVTFPKGIVQKPSITKEASYWLKDNTGTLVIFIGAVVSLCIYLFGWIRYGRDPKKGTIIPLYAPPRNLPPEDLRYIQNMGSYDNKILTAAIINMAVNGCIIIEELKVKGKKGYTITKTGENNIALSPVERVMYKVMPETLELKQEYNKDVPKIIEKLKNELSGVYKNTYFNSNSGFLAAGIVIALISAIAGFAIFNDSLSEIVIIPGIILIAEHFVFWFLLKAPTVEGRKLMDEIEGFKLFLSVAEKDRLNFLNPPDKTPELFEKYLPYALALDVEQKWAKQFSQMFSQMEENGIQYSPLWYTGAAWDINNTANFAGSFNNSFSTVISSASVAPGSSSGSGGFSGGGGGGGGGGGW